MARVYRVPHFRYFFVFFTIVSCCFTSVISESRELDEDNWRDILEGEWMVEFYAPWCPACTALAPAWKDMSARASKRSLNLRAGAVDVTKSPGLSGRFVVTALPTIYHVKDGEFRQYKGPRDADSLLSFVEQQRWKQTEPVPGWKAPHSIQMSLVAEFFRLSQALRLYRQSALSHVEKAVAFVFSWCLDLIADLLMNVHNTLMETYGLPTWGSYLIFAIGTILIGSLLGLLLVCVIDLLYPPRKHDKVFMSKEDGDKIRNSSGNKSDDEQELINDDIIDDAEGAHDSDAERNSPSDSSDTDKEQTAGGDTKSADEKEKTEVRKRRPRKAD